MAVMAEMALMVVEMALMVLGSLEVVASQEAGCCPEAPYSGSKTTCSCSDLVGSSDLELCRWRRVC